MQAEWEIGVSGPNMQSPLIAPMSKPYPVPPLPLKSSGALVQKAAEKLNLVVTPNVAAIITEPYNGRSGCIHCGMCSGYGCQVKARSSSAVSLLPIAVATDLNPGSSPVHSLLAAMNMASVLFGLTPEETLRGVTVNAARALGLNDRGVLAPGLRADIALWEVERPGDLSYPLGLNPLKALMRGGEMVRGAS